MNLSIITPSYNQGEFIKRTIDSVLNQGVDVEYFVADGGSTDETVEILKSYHKRLQWVSEKDNGQTDAVNKGIKRVSGDIIGWINSDDTYEPNAFNKVLEVFKKNQDVNMIYGNANHITINDEYIEDYYTEKWNFERLKEVCFICQPTVFFRKNVFEKYGLLNDKLNYCMDYEYWLRVGMHENFYYIEQKLANSRLYEDNKTLGARVKVHEEIIQMQKDVVGNVHTKWIYNLAHILSDEDGFRRDTPQANYDFVISMTKHAKKLFKQYVGKVPIAEKAKMLRWIRGAKGEI